jgi:chorismate synthase
VGGIVRCEALNVPAGLGEPAFDKLDALLAHAMLSIGSIKGIEFGSGFEAAERFGSENNDPITPEGFSTNHAGGVLGGISNGAPVVFNVSVKPTPSIARMQDSVDLQTMQPEKLEIRGRHDPCVAVRAVPIVIAATALGILDAMLDL